MHILQMRKSKSGKLSVLFKMTQLVKGTDKVQTQVCLTPKPVFFLPTMHSRLIEEMWTSQYISRSLFLENLIASRDLGWMNPLMSNAQFSSCQKHIIEKRQGKDWDR